MWNHGILFLLSLYFLAKHCLIFGQIKPQQAGSCVLFVRPQSFPKDFLILYHRNIFQAYCVLSQAQNFLNISCHLLFIRFLIILMALLLVAFLPIFLFSNHSTPPKFYRYSNLSSNTAFF